MSSGLEELVIPGLTSKGSHYHKAYYSYPQAVAVSQVGAIRAGQILIEINSFANPYPVEQCVICSFLTDFLIRSGNEALVSEYEMQAFPVCVLDRRRTLSEKLVSLMRCSLSPDPIVELSAKIRHFYDLHFLFCDNDCRAYLMSPAFKDDFISLFKHDQQTFDRPLGWQEKSPDDSPLLSHFTELWRDLHRVYLRELPDLAYKDIPNVDVVERSILAIIACL